MNELIKSLIIQAIVHLIGTVLMIPFSPCCTNGLMENVVWIKGDSGTDAMNDKLTEDEYIFSMHHFAEVVALHDELRPKLTEARELLAAHAAELALLVKSLPGADLLSESSIRDHVRYGKKTIEKVSGKSVFEPWTNKWKGIWSNGRPQYQIWDETRLWGEQWIQVVAQSEYGFPEEPRLEHLLKENKTDLGINVYAEEYGITGWVSKRQHGRLEIPCLGYLIDETSLLWVCLMDYIGKLDANSGQWFVYLEKVESTAQARHYVIAGHPFTIGDRVVWNKNLSSLHAGRYTAE